MKRFIEFLRNSFGVGLLLWGLASDELRLYAILAIIWLCWVFRPEQPKPSPRPIPVPPEPPVTTPAPLYDEFGRAASGEPSLGPFSPEVLEIARAQLGLEPATPLPHTDGTPPPATPSH